MSNAKVGFCKAYQTLGSGGLVPAGFGSLMALAMVRQLMVPPLAVYEKEAKGLHCKESDPGLNKWA